MRSFCLHALGVLFILYVFTGIPPVAWASGQSQTIKILPIADQTVGVAPFQVIAIASSGLPVALDVAGPAQFNGRLLTITGPGTVTVSAHQAGNSVYDPADAQQMFTVRQGVPAIQWSPGSIVYGTPLDDTMRNASATAVPVADPAADVSTITWQLNTSQITGGRTVTTPATSPVFRYEGVPVIQSPYPNDAGGMIPNPAFAVTRSNRVAFTCDCQQFEFVIQSRGSAYRLWVDGVWASSDFLNQENHYPAPAFYRVQFPDKRPRQIRLAFTFSPPFMGVITTGDDTVSAPQTPLGPKVTIFGDSWTVPMIVQPALPPMQPGQYGSGYEQVLGEYFNWDWRESGFSGSGFIAPGASNSTFLQSEQANICAFRPDMVLVMGGINDKGTSTSAMAAAVTQFFTTLQTCLPQAKIFFVGPQFTIAGVSDGIHDAVANLGNPIPYDDPGIEDWFYGSPTDPSTGNAYLYLNGHPTSLGHDYWAEKIADFLIENDPSIAPQTYPLFAPVPITGTYSYSPDTNDLLPAGQQNLSVTFTPQDSANYATVTQSAVLTVEKASSTTSVASSASSISIGAAFNLTATVSPQIGGVPTGTVTFLDNGNSIGSSPLSGGLATLSTSALAAGAHVITVSYSGDGNFYGSTSSTGSIVNVSAPTQPSDFSFTLDKTQLNVTPNKAATLTVTVTPIAGLSANLGLSCSGLPANASCSLQNGDHIVVNQQTTQAIVTIQTLAGTTASTHGSTMLRGAEFCGLLGFFVFFGRRSRKALSTLVISSLLLVAGLSLLSGCGTSPKTIATPAKTYQVQVTLFDTTDPSMSHSQPVAVTIP